MRPVEWLVIGFLSHRVLTTHTQREPAQNASETRIDELVVTGECDGEWIKSDTVEDVEE